MIRRAEKKDSEDVRILMEQLEGHSFDAESFREFYEKALLIKDYLMWVYELDGKAVGILTLMIKHPIHHMSLTGEIAELTVHEEFRNRKIGEKLLGFAEDYVIRNNLTEIELNSKKIRVDAHRFYFRHGYEDLRNNLTKEFK